MESKGDSPPPGFKEELEEISNEPRNWKGILIALLVIVSICSLISLAILILSPHLGSGSNKSRLKVEDIFERNGSHPGKGSNATWVSSKEILYRDTDGTIYLYDIESNWKTVLASNNTLDIHKPERYSLSENKKYILLVYDISPKNSFSITAKYAIYDTAQSLITPLNGSSTTASIYDDDSLQFASWGPKGSQLLYIYRNDLYYIPRLSDRPNTQADRHIRLTYTGREGLVWNGIPDLVNEEFVLKQGTAFWWHSSGDKLVYAMYDNSQVDMMPVVVYGPDRVTVPSDDDDMTSFIHNSGEYERRGSYPRVVNYPYPKPLRRNSQVTLWLISDLRGDPKMVNPIPVRPPPEVLSSEHYLVDVSWVDDRTVSVLWSRRSWNTTFLTLCTEEKGWNCEILHAEHLTGSRGWLSVNNAPIFSPDKEYYFVILPVADGTAGTYNHIKMIYEDKKSHFLTHGQFVVTKLLYYRHDIHTLYYQATSISDPGTRHIWSVVDMDVPEPERRRMTSCLSCTLPPSCLYNDAKFSPNGGNYVILECKGPGAPRTELRRLPDNILVEELNLNPSYISWLESKVMPKIKVINVPLLQPPGTFIRVELLLPPNLVESEPSHHFPLVISLDGRPETQLINHENKLTWGHYLVSSRDYIHVSIDGRGSGFQGNKMKQSIYHHLGEYQATDVVTVVQYLKTLGYVDKDKVAIYGKGMGGHLVVDLMSHSDHFTCGVAVAPVTSWRNFASAFVEKYMGLPIPQDNYANYDKRDLVRNLGHNPTATNIKDKQLLIAHGTGDRIVSIQHSMLLMKALTNQGYSYKIQMYPDGEHSLFRERYHLHQVMEDLFAACFKVEDDEDDRLGDMTVTRVIKTKIGYSH